MDKEKIEINPEDNEPENTVLLDSDSKEVEEATEDADYENSTVLGKSTVEKIDKPVSSSKKRFKIFIALIVVALVVAGGIFAAIKLLPESDEEETEKTTTINLKSISSEDISKIVINNSYGELVFIANDNPNAGESNDDGTTETARVWTLQGYDENLIASSSVNAAADSMANLSAVREMTERDLDYGFSKPYLKAQVYLKDSSGDYTVTVGNMSPDKTGYYMQVSGDDKIYLVAISTVNNIDTSPEKLADSIIINVPVKDSDTKASDRKYFDDDDKLESFDSIELSGTKFNDKVSLLPVEDSEVVDYYLTAGKTERYADTDKVESVFGIATNGIVAVDAYKLNPTSEDLVKYGLDKPEHIVEIKYGSNTVKLSATLYDKENNYYAVIVNGRDAIYAVTSDALEMLSYKTEDFYNAYVFLEYMNAFSNITVKTPEKTYSFDINYDEDEEEITAFVDGNKIDNTLLSAYYQYFVVISPENKESYSSGETEFTATFTYSDKKLGKKVLKLVKQTERRYLVVIDDQKLGIVNSSVFDNLVKYAQYVVDEKGIPDAE